MARIRSIKPEFITDGKIMKLSDSVALFYILLWTHCDDEGKINNDPIEISGKLGGRWHQGKVKLFVSCLIKSGQLRLNSDSTWLQVVSWSHQKIDKPKQPKVKSEDLQWLSATDSTNALESSRGINARIGSDRRDQGSSATRAKLEKSPPEPDIDFGSIEPAAVAVVPQAETTATPIGFFIFTWERQYNSKFAERKKLAGIMKHLVSEVGVPRALQLVEAYFMMKDPLLVKRAHDVGTFQLKRAEIARFADSGVVITNAVLGDVDRDLLEKKKRDQLYNEFIDGKPRGVQLLRQIEGGK